MGQVIVRKFKWSRADQIRFFLFRSILFCFSFSIVIHRLTYEDDALSANVKQNS